MLIPNKHINNSKSLLGLGCFIIETLSTPKTVDEIWNLFRKSREEERYATSHSFDSIILAIGFLFSIGIIDENNSGKIFKCG
jgi:hypothetical protein